MRKLPGIGKNRWLGNPGTPAEVELRQALDQGAKRAADEVALRRVWGRLSEIPNLVPSSEREGASDRHQAHGNSHDKFFDERRVRRGRWAWVVAASLAGATATLTFMLMVGTTSEFRVERGPVPVHATSSAPGAAAATAAQGSTLVAPATVRTGLGETLHLTLRGGTKVTVTSESALVLDEDDRPAVSSGEVQFQVPHQPAGQTFAVIAGSYRVVVVGTRFRVRLNQAEAAVDVEEGVVEIWTDHRLARVQAGESWVSQPGPPTPRPRDGNTTATVEPTPAPGPARRSALALTRSGNSSSRRGSGARAAGAARDAREVLALSSPGEVAGSAGFSSASSAGKEFPAAPVPANDAAAPRMTVVVPAVDLPPAIAPPPPAAAPVNTTPLAVQARSARAAGDSRRALGLYRALAEQGGAAGENAEYEIARLLRDNLHQPREAVSAWRLYRAQHPRGLLRVETDISVIETLVALGDKTAAVAEATDFMRRYPDSERCAEVARLAGDLLRERGACEDAVVAYDVALGRSHVRREVSDSSSYYRAVCLLRADRGAGVAALQSYLTAFPAGGFRGEAQRLISGADGSQHSPGVR
ncbi:MAG: FecR family protein [Polyangia bacterium]